MPYILSLYRLLQQFSNDSYILTFRHGNYKSRSFASHGFVSKCGLRPDGDIEPPCTKRGPSIGPSFHLDACSEHGDYEHSITPMHSLRLDNGGTQHTSKIRFHAAGSDIDSKCPHGLHVLLLHAPKSGKYWILTQRTPQSPLPLHASLNSMIAYLQKWR